MPGALDESEALSCVKVSIADVEKTLAAKHGIPVTSKNKDCGKARTETLLDGLIERKDAKWLMIVG